MTAGRIPLTSNKNWCTPEKYVDAIMQFYDGSIDLDPCGNPSSIIKSKVTYCLPEKNGLKESWDYKKIYVNPPYGLDRENKTSIKDWLRLCALAHQYHGSEVMALVPVATNTKHWKEYVFGRASSVCFLADTRLRFRINGNELNRGAPMSCAMVYWGKNNDRLYDVFSSFGAAVVHIMNLIKC